LILKDGTATGAFPPRREAQAVPAIATTPQAIPSRLILLLD